VCHTGSEIETNSAFNPEGPISSGCCCCLLLLLLLLLGCSVSSLDSDYHLVVCQCIKSCEQLWQIQLNYSSTTLL
jgi:hypothetical protein